MRGDTGVAAPQSRNPTIVAQHVSPPQPSPASLLTGVNRIFLQTISGLRAERQPDPARDSPASVSSGPGTPEECGAIHGLAASSESSPGLRWSTSAPADRRAGG